MLTEAEVAALEAKVATLKTLIAEREAKIESAFAELAPRVAVIPEMPAWNHGYIGWGSGAAHRAIARRVLTKRLKMFEGLARRRFSRAVSLTAWQAGLPALRERVAEEVWRSVLQCWSRWIGLAPPGGVTTTEQLKC